MAGGIQGVLGLQFLFGLGFGFTLAPPKPEVVQETFNIARVEEKTFNIAQVADVTLSISGVLATEFER